MQTIINKIYSKFREIFNEEPVLVRSPGRVNLIGEHTDYNEGFVLPAAIDKAMFFAVSPRTDSQCSLHASDLNDSYQCELSSLIKSEKGWPNYLMGVVDQIKKLGYALPGFNCVFGGNIPIAAGLSSSAALEGGLAFALNEIYDFKMDKLSLVKLSQKAENEFVGVQCGIMDQLINIFGREKQVLKLDCRTLEYEYFPFERDDLRIVLCDTQVKRELAASEYNLRRSQCEEGIKLLRKYNNQIHSLRDVNIEFLAEHSQEFDPVIYKRCKYVIEENERVLSACRDLVKNDFVSFGQQMYESHAGLRDDYEVSCPELDVLVEGAAQIEGVFGARMMGAGFGGCTINLVQDKYLDDFKFGIEKIFRKRLKQSSKIYVTKIEAGTSVLNEKLVHV